MAAEPKPTTDPLRDIEGGMPRRTRAVWAGEGPQTRAESAIRVFGKSGRSPAKAASHAPSTTSTSQFGYVRSLLVGETVP